MSRTLFLSTLLLGVGSALLLSQIRSFSRSSLLIRLKPYTQTTVRARQQPSSIETLRDVLEPLVRDTAERLSSTFGVRESLAVRLDRINAKDDVTALRMRQTMFVIGTFCTAGALAIGASLPVLVTIVLLVCLPMLAFLLFEQHFANESAKWQASLTNELPVVAEQIAMLLSAGYSLTGSLARIAERGQGKSGIDIDRVLTRLRHGIDESTALSEWESRANVPAVTQLVSVLKLNRHASNLSALVTEEARNIRRDAHRELIETIERRGQQVWIPVTVATLIPGSIFLIIPFLDAVKVFSGS